MHKELLDCSVGGAAMLDNFFNCLNSYLFLIIK